MNRNQTLDLTRTLAIVLMVIFHFIYDLRFFSWIDTDIPDGDGWRHFRWLIVTLFFLCLGASLTLTHKHGFKRRKFFKRVLQISAAAALISISSYIAVPNNWIFFGVLHFLAVSSLIVVVFVKRPVLSVCIGLFILVFGALQILPSRWPFHLLFEQLPQYTNDYVAIQPWLGMVFLGVGLAHSNWFKNDPLKPLVNNASLRLQNVLITPGQHSLLIYLLHQPILLGGMYLISIAID